MHKQALKFIQTPSTSTHYITRTPEKAINISPFRGYSHSDKQSMTPTKNNLGYPQVQQTINQNISTQQFPYSENMHPFVIETREQLIQRILNLQENLQAITIIYEQQKDDLDKERTKKCETDRSYRQLHQKFQDQEKEVQKQQSIAKSIENKYEQAQREIQEQKLVYEKFQKLLKQKEKEINEYKLKIIEEKDLRALENDKLIQEFTQTYKELSQSNDQILQENNELKSAILEFSNLNRSLSQKRQSEQNFQTNTDFLDDPDLRQIIQEYLINDNEYYLNQIPEKQLRTAITIIKDIILTFTSKKLHEIKSQHFQQPKQFNDEIELNLQEVKQKRESLIKEIKKKLDKIVKSKEFNLIEFNDQQKEIDELKKELSTVDNLIQQMEQSLILNPHRNSCVSFDNEEFQ